MKMENIKVVVNYPESKEEREKLKETQARSLAKATLQILTEIMTPAQLDELMKRL